MKFAEYIELKETLTALTRQGQSEIMVGSTLKLKVVKNELGEYEVRVLNLVGRRWVKNEPQTYYTNDLEDAITTMGKMAGEFGNQAK